MSKYARIENPIVEALDFDEFVEYGKNQPDVNINDGMPWSFKYMGFSVTHENDEKYIIDGLIYFNKGQILVSIEDKKIWVMDKADFENSYSKLID